MTSMMKACKKSSVGVDCLIDGCQCSGHLHKVEGATGRGVVRSRVSRKLGSLTPNTPNPIEGFKVRKVKNGWVVVAEVATRGMTAMELSIVGIADAWADHTYVYDSVPKLLRGLERELR